MPLIRQVHPLPDAPAAYPLPYLAYSSGVTPPQRNLTTDDNSTSMFANAQFFTTACRSTDQIGSWVVAVGDIPKVRTADSSEPLPVVGLLVAKYNDTQAVVQRVGRSSYKFSGLQPTKRYFLADNGTMAPVPLPKDSIEFAQQVGYALDEDDFFVQCTQQITRRALSGDFVLDLGAADPVDGKPYPATDLYIDRTNLTAHLRPSAAGKDSAIYAGDGPPPDVLAAAQLLHIDPEASDIYLTDSTLPGNTSGIVVASGAPAENEKPSESVWYFDQSDAELFPRKGGETSI